MNILRFYREEGKYWYADIPTWTGRKSATQMVAGADTLLDILSNNTDEVYLQFSDTPIKGGDVLKKTRKSVMSWFNGADYVLETLNGDVIDLDVWLCNVTKFVMGKFPHEIYFKVVKPVKK